MKKKKIAKIINRYIDELKSGKQVHFWDAAHCPTKAERRGHDR